MSGREGCAEACQRAADALMRRLGGRTVKLRLASPAVAGVDAEQMGLDAPVFQDIAMSPALVKQTDAQRVKGEMSLAVSATAVKGIVGSLAFSSASVLFASAAGVLVEDVLMRITDAGQDELFGDPYVFRLTLSAPLTRVV